MRSCVYEFFGVNYYTHGTGLVLVFPFVVWLFFAVILLLSQLAENFFEKADKSLKWRSVLIPAAMIPISFVVAFWDVYLIGQQATKLCKEQAGLHVYKTVEAEGFIGDSSIDYWSKYGFKYVEKRDFNDKIRYTIIDGKSKYEQVDEFHSKYEYLCEKKFVGNRIIKVTYYMKSTSGVDVLGTYILFVVHGGWVDMLFINLTGFSYSGWECRQTMLNNEGFEFDSDDLIRATLKPVKMINRGYNE